MARNGEIEPERYMAHAMNLIRDHALHWPEKANTDFRSRYLKGSLSVSEANALHNLLNQALKELNDGHSRLITPAMQQRRALGRPEARLVNGVAIVVVPACTLPSQSAAQAFANTIAEHIQNLARSQPVGWIVDLRNNFGGNMWPMLAGLYPLIGPGMVGAFVDREGRRQNWILSWGAASVGDQIRCTIKAEASGHQQTGRIAILTDRRTASSGEAIATAFRSWPRSRSFGDRTAGLSTSNSSFQMPDGCILALTTGVFMDREGVTYGGPLTPDERVDPQWGDETVEKASAWIKCQT